ncbi:MAG: hypothetical protein WBW94_03155 [Anaerolineales bacterium]
MENLVLPDFVQIQLNFLGDKFFNLSNLVLVISCFARKKNDFHLGPFFSTEEGVFRIDHSTLEIAELSTIDSGIMDYHRITNCYPDVQISLETVDDIKRIIKGRDVWGVMQREKPIYKNKTELLARLSDGLNKREKIVANPEKISVRWDGSVTSYFHTINISLK